MDTYIQITQLPTLQEFSHDDRELPAEKVLAKAVALQLKPARAHITQVAFDRLLMLVDGQLNDMIAHLHRMSNLQRRESIAKGDLEMLLEGFHLTPSSLDEQQQASGYYRDTYRQEFDHLHSLKEINSNAKDIVSIEDREAVKQNVASILVPPTNPLQKILPKWLPNFPPDHTYRFTPQYRHPITDETVIRRKIVEEGKKSELALAHLSQRTPKGPLQDVEKYDAQLAQEETLAVYGTQKKRKKTTASSADLLSKLPQTNFSVEEYAHGRVEIARKKVLEFEERQWQAQQDPFLKLSRIAFTPFNEKYTRRQAQKEFQSALKRSFLHLVKGLPELERIKSEAEAAARAERNKRLEELRARKIEQEQMGEKDVLDLNEFQHNQEDFFAMESSEDEMEPVRPEHASQKLDESGSNENQTIQQSSEISKDAAKESVDGGQGERVPDSKSAEPRDQANFVQSQESIAKSIDAPVEQLGEQWGKQSNQPSYQQSHKQSDEQQKEQLHEGSRVEPDTGLGPRLDDELNEKAKKKTNDLSGAWSAPA